MTLDPSAALQDTVGKTLAGALSCAVYDRVPLNPAFPFVHIGEDQILTNDDYGDWSEAHVTVHVYSRAEGMAEVKSIAGAVRDALSSNLDPTGFDVYEYRLVSTQYMMNPDGLTQHAVVEIAYSIQPTG